MAAIQVANSLKVEELAVGNTKTPYLARFARMKRRADGQGDFWVHPNLARPGLGANKVDILRHRSDVQWRLSCVENCGYHLSCPEKRSRALWGRNPTRDIRPSDAPKAYLASSGTLLPEAAF